MIRTRRWGRYAVVLSSVTARENTHRLDRLVFVGPGKTEPQVGPTGAVETEAAARSGKNPSKGGSRNPGIHVDALSGSSPEGQTSRRPVESKSIS